MNDFPSSLHEFEQRFAMKQLAPSTLRRCAGHKVLSVRIVTTARLGVLKASPGLGNAPIVTGKLR